jgi:hypothetical protein
MMPPFLEICDANLRPPRANITRRADGGIKNDGLDAGNAEQGING